MVSDEEFLRLNEKITVKIPQYPKRLERSQFVDPIGSPVKDAPYVQEVTDDEEAPDLSIKNVRVISDIEWSTLA